MATNDRAIQRTQANLITLQAGKIAELEALIEVQAWRIKQLEKALMPASDQAAPKADC